MALPAATPPQGNAPQGNAPQGHAPQAGGEQTKLVRVAIWVAITALVVAALVCVVMVLVGSAGGIVPRALLTVLLMAGFAGVTILDVNLARRRPVWFALTSMIVWVVTLLIGAVMIWMPFRLVVFLRGDAVAGRIVGFLLIVLILQLALLHVRLYVKAWQRRPSTFSTVVAWITIGLVALLTVSLVFPLMLGEWVRFHDLYWRLVVAVAILAAVGTALLPLVNALLTPRPSVPVAPPVTGLQPWPTYADGRTPLPIQPDGSPDWNAYRLGHPSVPAAFAPPAAAPAPVGAPAGLPAPAHVAPLPAPSSAPVAGAAPASQVVPEWPAPEPVPPIAPEHAAPSGPAASGRPAATAAEPPASEPPASEPHPAPPQPAP